MHTKINIIAIISCRRPTMARMTIRNLDEAIKADLRVRSARNGRSVEEEVRVILREVVQKPQGLATAPSQAAPALSEALSRVARPTQATDEARVTLIIGGGIAAYKALDLIRRLKERRIRVRCVLARAAQQFVTPLAARALSDERANTELFEPEREC